MSACDLGPDHPEFELASYPGGTLHLEVCWDSTNVREVAAKLREVAAGLDTLPEDTTVGSWRP